MTESHSVDSSGAMNFVKFVLWVSVILLRIFVRAEDPAPLVNGSLPDFAKLIRTYFTYRSIWDLNIYLCEERDAYFVTKVLLNGNYKVNVKSEYNNLTVGSRERIGHFIDMSCRKNLKFYEHKVLQQVWLLYGLEGGTFRLDSDVVLCHANGELWDLSETRDPAGDQNNPVLPDRKIRYNLGGRHLRGVFLDFGFIQYDEANKVNQILDNSFFPDRETDERYMYSLLKPMSEFYNFKIDMKLADTWGVRVPNGSFTGMIGLLDRGEADFGISSSQMREDRFTRIDFLQPLQHLRVIFFFLEERVLGTYRALFTPFSGLVWSCIVGLILCVGCVFGVIAREEPTQGLVYVIGILSQQGLVVKTDGAAIKVLSLCLLFVSIMIYAMYNAAIMNGLLSPNPVTIKDLEDLKKSPCRLVMAKTAHMISPVNQKRYVPKEVLARIQSGGADWLMETAEALQRARHEKLCIALDDASLYPVLEEVLAEDEMCNVREVLVTWSPLTTPLPKGSPYREVMAQGTIKMIENGMANRMKNIWYPEKPPCLKSTVFVHVSLEAVSVALACWLSGVILSLIIVSIEIQIEKRMENIHKYKNMLSQFFIKKQKIAPH